MNSISIGRRVGLQIFPSDECNDCALAEEPVGCEVIQFARRHACKIDVKECSMHCREEDFEEEVNAGIDEVEAAALDQADIHAPALTFTDMQETI